MPPAVDEYGTDGKERDVFCVYSVYICVHSVHFCAYIVKNNKARAITYGYPLAFPPGVKEGGRAERSGRPGGVWREGEAVGAYEGHRG